MKIALVGLGDIAQKAYLPVMATMANITPVLCTRDEKTLLALANQYRIEQYTTEVEELLTWSIDAVMIHSTTASHAQLVALFLQAGIATFVDKPISYFLDETESLLTLAAQKHIPFFVGFNRRYAPLIANINEDKALHIDLIKNRANITAPVREFIFDDFIHAIDTLRFLSKKMVENFVVKSHFATNGELAAVYTQWQAGDTLCTANMNRICGLTEEVLQVYGQQKKWRIAQLTTGIYVEREKITPLGFDDWQATLYKRGFVDMLQTFIKQVQQGYCNSEQLNDIFLTHQLCEQIVQKINTP